MWAKMKSDVGPITTKINEAEKYIELVTGCTIDFWSLDDPNSGRGRKYKRVIIDEARKVKNLEYAWNQTIRPTLIDLKGDAWLLSSPQGHGSYLNLMYEEAQTNDEWFTYTAPSFENPYLDPQELEDAAKTMDELAYQQEIMGIDVQWSANARFYSAFERAAHVSVTSLEYDKSNILGLSFDFNVDPMTCIAYQTDKWNYLYILKEFRLPQSEVFDMCKSIMNFFETDHVPAYKVTGDASGYARQAGVKGMQSNYDIIRSEMSLGPAQIVTPKSNMRISARDHADSRTLVNGVFQNLADLRIDPDCEWLIKDMEFVMRKLNSKGEVEILKDNNMNASIRMKNSELGHLGDCLRYAIHTEFNNFLKDE